MNSVQSINLSFNNVSSVNKFITVPFDVKRMIIKGIYLHSDGYDSLTDLDAKDNIVTTSLKILSTLPRTNTFIGIATQTGEVEYVFDKPIQISSDYTFTACSVIDVVGAVTIDCCIIIDFRQI